MKRMRSIISWSEPAMWNEVARRHAKEQGFSSFPWLSWGGTLLFVGGLTLWKWFGADPATRVSVAGLATIITVLFAVLTGLGWIHMRLNRTNSTALYAKGMAHGSLINKKWIRWSQIEYFYTDEHTVGSHEFRFLNWQEAGKDDESFSVVPDTVDLESAVQIFRNNQVEQAADGDSEEAL